MNTAWILTADDYGLSRGITDAILEAADAGALTQVSGLANGEALAYALDALEKRKDVLALSAHLNLTEGKALGDPAVLPHLTDAQGNFRHSVLGLLRSYFFAGPAARSALHAEIRRELTLQLAALEARGPVASLDGHQHVHMAPFVFDVVLELARGRRVRLPREPLYLPSISEAPRLLMRLPAWGMLRFLAWSNGRQLSGSSKRYFLGFLFSGRMNEESVRAGFSRMQELRAEEIEIAFHPGSALPGELSAWRQGRADIAWHYSPWRGRERALLLRPDFKEFINNVQPHSFLSRMMRFVLAGTIAALINLMVLYGLTEFGGFWYLYSAALAFGCAFILSFTLQKFWTFGHRSFAAAGWQLPAYLGLQLFNLGLNLLGLALLVQYLHIWYLLAQIIALIVIAGWTFIVSRYLFAS